VRDIRLGRFFNLSEFILCETALRRGMIIEPPQHIIDSLRALVKNVLDPLRTEIGPLIVISGYRPYLLNRLHGGSAGSDHIFGQAADVRSAKYVARQVLDTAVRMQLPFDRGMVEFDLWTHLSYRPNPRREVLKASFLNGGINYERIPNVNS
jgi:zinc D-Ala-D-Ala carboxypeptidase